MNRMHLRLAGLKIALETPEEIPVTDRLLPFLTPQEQTPDCVIAVKLQNTLPQPDAAGVWCGPTFYSHCGNKKQIYHCPAPKAAPFAVTQFEDSGVISLLVLQEYAHYFSGISGIFNRISMENLLLRHDCLLLHASLIKFGEKTVAFAGPSGVGKSTQAALWEKYAGAEILNGDRTLLRRQETGWTAWGSPYAGTSGIYNRDGGDVCALVLLSQGQENRLQRLGPGQAFRCLFPELTMPQWDETFAEQATELFRSLVEAVPVWHLECLPEISAVTLLKEGIGL